MVQAYANNLVDYHLVMDLVPSLAFAFFKRSLPATLSAGQAAILLSLGLQQSDVSTVEKALNLPMQQVLALFNKVWTTVPELALHEASMTGATGYWLQSTDNMSTCLIPRPLGKHGHANL